MYGSFTRSAASLKSPALRKAALASHSGLTARTIQPACNMPPLFFRKRRHNRWPFQRILLPFRIDYPSAILSLQDNKPLRCGRLRLHNLQGRKTACVLRRTVPRLTESQHTHTGIDSPARLRLHKLRLAQTSVLLQDIDRCFAILPLRVIVRREDKHSGLLMISCTLKRLAGRVIFALCKQRFSLNIVRFQNPEIASL